MSDVIDPDEVGDDDIDQLWNLVRRAASGDLTHLSIPRDGSEIYFPANVLRDSVIQIITE